MRTRELAVAVSLCLACGASEQVRTEPIVSPLALAPVAQARLYSGYCEPARLVIRTQADWEAVWAQVVANVSPVPPAPAVDFGQEMLLFAALGARSHGGYAIDIEEAGAVQEGSLVATVVETSPGASCLTTQAIECPVVAVRTEARDEPVEFRTESIVHECGP